MGIFGFQNLGAQRAKLYPKPNIPTRLFPEEMGWGCGEPPEQPLMNDFTLPKE